MNLEYYKKLLETEPPADNLPICGEKMSLNIINEILKLRKEVDELHVLFKYLSNPKD